MKIALFGEGNARDHGAFERLTRELGTASFYGRQPNALLEAEQGVFLVKNAEDAAERASGKVDLLLILDPVHLISGAADVFRRKGVKVVAPSLGEARLEGSKALTKRILGSEVPSPLAIVCQDLVSVLGQLRRHWRDDAKRFVLKSDLFIRNAHFRTMLPETLSQALDMATEQWAVIQNEAPGDVLLEERLDGEELSLHVAFDGDTYLLFPPVKDYKRALDDDQGPNTHGVAALAFGAGYSPKWERSLRQIVVEPVLNAIQRAGLSYGGFLYIGVILTDEGPKVLELNVRPGNPEFPALLPLLESSFSDLVEALGSRGLHRYGVTWQKSKVSAAVFATARGYPVQEEFDATQVHGAEAAHREGTLLGEGLSRIGGRLVVTGGRVILATAVSHSLDHIRKNIYQTLDNVQFDGQHFRRDLGSGLNANLIAKGPSAEVTQV